MGVPICTLNQISNGSPEGSDGEERRKQKSKVDNAMRIAYSAKDEYYVANGNRYSLVDGGQRSPNSTFYIDVLASTYFSCRNAQR